MAKKSIQPEFDTKVFTSQSHVWPFTLEVITALGSSMKTDDEKRLIELVNAAEQSYDEMYERGNDRGMCYVSAREDLTDAAILAKNMGRKDLEERIIARLTHIKDVHRTQFSG